MRNQLVFVGVLLAAISGCKKSDTGGGGGGGGWLVGDSALMSNVGANGAVGAGYALDDTASLYGIACRDTSAAGEAWVVGAAGTVLYTDDAGDSWTAQAVPATTTLRAVATMDSGPLFVAGDATFLTSNDSGASWTAIGDGVTNFRAVSTAEGGDAVLAISSDGGVWSFANQQLAKLSTQPGARSIALSESGDVAILAGEGLSRSLDGGHTWTALTVDPSLTFDEAWVDSAGGAIAVGSSGAIATIDSAGNVSVSHVGTANLHTIRISDDGFGLAGGDDGQTVLTDDSGATWQAGPTLAHTVRSVDEIGAGHR